MILLGGTFLGIVGRLGAAEDRRPPVERGRELFGHEWRPQDAWSLGGDGLGPVYNDTSCIACHNLGAPGGAGPDNKSAEILTAVKADGNRLSSVIAKAVLDQPKNDPSDTSGSGPNVDELAKAHAGFAAARSVVLHRFGTDPGYERWRSGLLGSPVGPQPPRLDAFGDEHTAAIQNLRNQVAEGDAARSSRRVAGFDLLHSRRNPTALFGAGRIDTIPDAVLEAQCESVRGMRVVNPRFPEITGRVGRLKDGRIGRFGWKAQTATLEDFVLTACAAELGLEVPGHHQAGQPMASRSGYLAPGLDLGAEDCAALVAYVRSLPAPTVREPSDQAGAEAIRAGRASFERIGCAACHKTSLGGIDGIYSDLLLHDMGGGLGDAGFYSIFSPGSRDSDSSDETPLEKSSGPVAQGKEGVKPTVGARQREWRTPPLWGVRDSAPYMHDGRARTLEQAIALHDGEAALTTVRYFDLKPGQRLAVESFLKSLAAPRP